MIAKNPRPSAKDKKTDKFIRGSKASAPARKLVPVLINFNRELLDRITEAARESGLNRSAFIVSAAAEKLRAIERP
jgi:hypothetical protein